MRRQYVLICSSANVGNARIQGMAKDLNLVGYRFNWVTSIFYIIYMFVEVPSNILLKKIGPKWYLPMLVVGFGFVSLCTAFVQSFEGLLAARAMLGVFEGGVMPYVLSLNFHHVSLHETVGLHSLSLAFTSAMSCCSVSEFTSRLLVWLVRSVDS